MYGLLEQGSQSRLSSTHPLHYSTAQRIAVAPTLWALLVLLYSTLKVRVTTLSIPAPRTSGKEAPVACPKLSTLHLGLVRSHVKDCLY